MTEKCENWKSILESNLEGYNNLGDCLVCWETAIGMQAVDGLLPSKEFITLVTKSLTKSSISPSGLITLMRVGYYDNGSNEPIDKDTMQADYVSTNIYHFLRKWYYYYPDLCTLEAFKEIHERLFRKTHENAGEFRRYNISKREWVLSGDTVKYGDCINIKSELEKCFTKAKKCSQMNQTEMVKYLSELTSSIWQVHPFSEGNTRTTACFMISYILTVTDFPQIYDTFVDNSLYFRNALVRACYENSQYGIKPTTRYLERFYENLLFDKKNKLDNQQLHISYE